MNIVNEKEKRKWQKEKEEWRNKVESISIPDDMNGRVTQIESQIDKVYTEASWHYIKYKNQLKKTQSVIDEVKKLNKKGKNKDRREANAMKALKNYKGGIDLLEYERELIERVSFFSDYVINVLEKKSRRVATSVGGMKVDAQLTPH